MSFTVFSYNATVLFIKPNPTHGWTQPMSISDTSPDLGGQNVLTEIAIRHSSSGRHERNQSFLSPFIHVEYIQIYTGWAKKPDCFLDLITLWWLVLERRAVC